jgi:hypothetical protein
VSRDRDSGWRAADYRLRRTYLLLRLGASAKFCGVRVGRRDATVAVCTQAKLVITFDIGSLRVVLRKGQLWLDGAIRLESAARRFYLTDEEHSPEWISFGEIVNGRCMRIKSSGSDLWRVETA